MKTDEVERIMRIEGPWRERWSVDYGGVTIPWEVEVFASGWGTVYPEVSRADGTKPLLEGHFAEAESLFEAALQEVERRFGTEDPRITISLLGLAEARHAQGKFAQAEPLYQRALAIEEKTLGAEHTLSRGTRVRLALLYEDWGKYAAAVPLTQLELSYVEKKAGPSHAETAGPLLRCAELYDAQGNFAEAEPLYRRALAIREKTLGAGHPSVVATANHLALRHRDQKRLGDALSLVTARLPMLKPNEPSRIRMLTTLAGIYADQREVAKAESQYKEALAIAEQALGSEDPEVAHVLKSWVQLLRNAERESEAAPFEARATTIRGKHIRTKPMRWPVEVSEGRCHLRVRLALPILGFFVIDGAGFDPNEEVNIVRRADGEEVKETTRTSADGRLVPAFSPTGAIGQRSGWATYSVASKSCHPTVEYWWGRPPFLSQ